VLIEILDALFRELETHLAGWFGKKKRSRVLIQEIRKELAERKTAADTQEEAVRRMVSSERGRSTDVSGGLTGSKSTAKVSSRLGEKSKDETERTFKILSDKIQDLDMWLPRLKVHVRDFFATSSSVKAVFLHIDDFYHLRKATNLLS
jgi:hypothetical protein